MRRLILSDIHGNLEALEGVLADLKGQFDEVLCLGDIVGYGPNPNEVTEWVRQNTAAVIRGNHDRACSSAGELTLFNRVAAAAVDWTREILTDANREWLANLPAGPLLFEGFEIAHGSPLDEDEYLLDDERVDETGHNLMRPICFIGHTHAQVGWTWTNRGMQRLQQVRFGASEELLKVEPDQFYLLNPGSVGQPRDRDPRAAYAVWDDEKLTVRFRRAPYDIAVTQQKILDAGLPEYLAERLSFGR